MPIKPAKDLVGEANNGIKAISAEEARRLHDAGAVQFVDVREPGEWAQGHVPGAVHVPRGLLEFAADPSIPTHKPELHAGKPLVIYCAAGGRSALATKTLKDMGFTDVTNLTGGFTAWAQGGNPVEK